MEKLIRSKKYPWLLVILYSLLGMTCPAAVTQYSMVVNELAGTLGVTTEPILFADSIRAVLLVIAMFACGLIYRRLGLRKTIALGIFFQASAQFLIPLAVELRSIPLLTVFKGMQGLNAIAFPLYLSTITLWIDDNNRGLSTALFNGSFMAGGGVGAWITGKLIPLWGWRSSFYVLGSLTVLFAIPVLLVTRDKEAVSSAPHKEKAATASAASPYGRIMKQPATWLLVIALIANTWISMAVNADMSVFAQNIGYDYGKTGDLMLLISFMTVLSSIAAGGISDRVACRLNSPVNSRCIVMALGYLLAAGGAMLLTPCSGSFTGLALSACAMMFGANWASGVFWGIPGALFSAEDNVSFTAFCSSASNIPNPIAPAVVGVLLGSRGMWGAGWMTCAIVSAISLAASLLLCRKPEKQAASSQYTE